MSILRVIGDIHGCINNRSRLIDKPSYLEICQQLFLDDYSVQIGDMGFDYSEISNNLLASRHRFFYGNHDNLDIYYDCPNALGDYGLTALGPFSFFFVRGAFSIDKNYRVKHEEQTGQKSWWYGEELTDNESAECLDLYQQIRPNVVITHDCPYIISNMIGNPTILQAFGWDRLLKTSSQRLFQHMFNVHKPKLWIFGHYHVNWEVVYKDTHFKCIAEREFIDFNQNWSMI